MVTKKITLDMNEPGSPPIVHAKQGESLGRALQISFVCDGLSWQAPQTVTVLTVFFRRRNGTGGAYGNTADVTVELSQDRKSANISLIDEVTEDPGPVEMDLSLMTSGSEIVTTFSWIVLVHPTAATATALHLLDDLRTFVLDNRVRALFLYDDSNDWLPAQSGASGEYSQQAFVGDCSGITDGDYVLGVWSGRIATADIDGQDMTLTGTGFHIS